MFVTRLQPCRAPHAASQAGFSLVELMIAITLGLLVLTSLAGTFFNSSRTRDEVERASQQIENGRYAVHVLSEDLRLAGYWAQFNVNNAGLAAPGSLPDPCAVTLIGLSNAIPVHIQGYDNPSAATIAALTCPISDWKPGTDVVVVRRVSTCSRGATDCPALTGAPYFQASFCGNSSELGSPTPTDQFRLDTNTANPPLDRHRKDCTTVQPDIRQVITRIYFIANNDASGDGIPTLKRAELVGTTASSTGFSIVSVSPGIENLQLEYGIDTNNDGIPDAMNTDPTSYNACAGPAAACSVTNWMNVMAVKINLLARNTLPTGGYTDGKTYTLGLMADGITANTYTPTGSALPYKRHVYQAEVRLTNAAVRRE
jgi:type IV pilus assembly protein PilW